MIKYICCADVVELADTLDLGSNAVRCAGSSPVIRTKKASSIQWALFYTYIPSIKQVYNSPHYPPISSAIQKAADKKSAA